MVVLNNGLPAYHDVGAEVLVDYKGDWVRKLGEETGRVLLARPDGHVAVNLDGLDVGTVTEAMEPEVDRRTAAAIKAGRRDGHRGDGAVDGSGQTGLDTRQRALAVRPRGAPSRCALAWGRQAAWVG